MIYSVKGEVVALESNLAVIETSGGVAFACRTTDSTVAALTLGEVAKLNTHLSVREDSMELFGFSDWRELICFRLLLSVSGIGPKAALAIMSVMEPDEFACAIVNGESARIAKAKGVGTKTAERAVLELKEKVEKQFDTSAKTRHASGKSGINHVADNPKREALNALMVLGFKAAEATEALDGAVGTSTSELVKEALRRLNRH